MGARARPDDHAADSGMVERECNRQVDQPQAVLLGERGKRVGRLELATVALERDIKPARDHMSPLRLGLRAIEPVAARQPAGGQRSIAEHAEAVLARDRERVSLGPANQQRVRQLRGQRRRCAELTCQPLRLDQRARAEHRGAVVQDLGLAHEVVERTQRLGEIGVWVRTVSLIEVDAIGLQAAQAALDRAHDPAAGIAPVRRVLADLIVEPEGERADQHA